MVKRLKSSFGSIFFEFWIVYCSDNSKLTPYGPGHAEKYVPYANSKGADQPEHPRSLISTFVVPCLDRSICILDISKV